MKHYQKEGFVEYKIEIDEEDLEEIIENDLRRHAELDFDEIEIVNNRPRNSGLYAQYRKHLDSEIPEEAEIADAKLGVSGEHEDSPTGM